MRFFVAFEYTLALFILLGVQVQLLPEFSSNVFGDAFAFGFVFLVLIFSIQRKISLDGLRNVRPKSTNRRIIGFILITITGLFLFERIVTESEILIRVGLDEYISRSEEIFSWGKRLKSFIRILIVGPIVEEYFFRHLLLSRMEEKYSKRTALIYSSILFSLVHISFGETAFSTLFHAFLAGIFFGWTYQLTGDLRITIFSHFFWNFLVYFLPFVMFHSEYQIRSLNDIILFFTITLLLSLGLMTFSKYLYKKITLI